MDIVAGAALTLAGSTVAGLIWVVKYVLKEVKPALDKLVEVTKKNTVATEKADSYLRERNGRDIEKHTELLKATQKIPQVMQQIANTQSKAIIQAVKIKEQHIEHQHVDKQDVSKL